MKINNSIPYTARRLTEEDISFFTMQSSTVNFCSEADLMHWLFTLNSRTLLPMVQYTTSTHFSIRIQLHLPFVVAVGDRIYSDPDQPDQVPFISISTDKPPGDIYRTMLVAYGKEIEG